MEDAEVSSVEGRLLYAYISGGHDYWGRHGEGRLQHGIADLEEVECVAGRGLRGDRYFDYRPDFKGQVTFFDNRVVEAVRKEFNLPKLPASVFRRNLIVEGIDLAEWKGRRFRFQNVIFEGTHECTPCKWMDRAIEKGALDFLRSDFRGGLRAKILTDGVLCVDGR